VDDFRPSLGVRRQLLEQSDECDEVLLELPHRDVEQAQLEPAQPVEGAFPGGGLVAQRRREEVHFLSDVRVGRGLDVQVDKARSV